ncbi:MAG: hypothetical protein HYZ44_12280 [Bacteroidetes bacterium]|nr:hypothetical protein [Bacteroidota bacterium]
MKKIAYSLVLLVALSFVYSSCSDDSLDPLQVNSIKKGKLLALRGTVLTNVYSKGLPAAEFFPRIATANDKFVFEAEYLAEDPKSLQSVDFYVLKKVGTTTTRELVKNVPFSAFVNDGKYKNPWVTVTITLSEILPKLGLSNTFPLDNTTINTLLTTYKFGINVEGDLNLTDGSKALAANVVAAGLFQSDQFYPAQKLVYTVTDYCSYVQNSWAATYTANEVYSNTVYGPYNLTFTQDGTDLNRFNTSNFWDSGYSAYMVFSPSSNPSTQTVTFPAQAVGGGGNILAGSTGTYDQCTGIVNINLSYKEGSATYDWRYNLVRQ